MDQSTTGSRPPDSIGQALLWALLPTLALFLIAPAASVAQVLTNITETTTTSLNLGTHVNPVGSTVEITGGTRPGSGTNLFHSFDSFTLGTGHVAHFMNDMHLLTTNIFARVIGKEVSTIDGTLRTNNPLNAADPMNFGAAHLWLVNPSGLLLGPNAHVEVGGSVSISTANYLRFGNQAALFDMLSTPASLGPLSVASVVAFGFLGPDLPAPITVQGSMLQVPPGQSLSLVGGDITIQAGTLDTGTIQAPSLRAQSGHLNLVSVASPGEVLLSTFETGSFTTMGTVTIKGAALLDVSGQLVGPRRSGTVFVRGGQLVMDASTILANTVGAVDGTRTAVDIQVLHDVGLSHETLISAGTSSAGRGGDVVIAAENVHLDTSSLILTKTSAPGRGGDVQITADSLTLENSSRITTQNSLLGLVGGDLSLNVGTLRLLGGSLIRSTNSTGTDLNHDGKIDVTGVGGNITVQGRTQGADSAANLVELSGGSGITSEAQVNGGGGGQISIRANILDLDGASTTIQSSTSASKIDLNGDGVFDVTGRGGDIVVAVQQLSVEGGAAIRSITSGTGSNASAGGMVTVQELAGPESEVSSVLLSGPNTGIFSNSSSGLPGDITVNTGTLTITNGAAISAGSTQSPGPAGKVTVIADSVVISAGGKISSLSFAQASGKVTITATNALTLDNGSIVTNTSSESGNPGGDVELNGGTVSLTNGARITSQSEKFSTGPAGNITITGKSLTLANQAEITSSSQGIVANAGDAGAITITTTGNAVSLTSGSSITSSTIGPGNAGEVIVLTAALNMDNATITTSTSGTGKAGGVTATVGTMNLTNGSTVSSNSTGTLSGAGDAGSVTIEASGSFTSNGSKVSTSAENATGGDILIHAQNVQLSNGTLISASSNAPFSDTGDGNAGNITIKSASSVVMQNSSVTTEASAASGGNIEIDAPDALMVQLVNSRLSTSVGGVADKSDGGNITIDPQFVVLQNSQILAQAFAGAGGAIDIIATSAFIADPASIVSASSTLGISGQINIQSPVQNVGEQLTPLSQQFSSAAALLAQQCAARAVDGKFSTFLVAAREGLPVEPGGFLASPSWTAGLFGSSLSGWDPHIRFPVVTAALPGHDATPIQLAKFGNACRQ